MAARLVIMALRNLRRQLRRTILTALTFAVAVFIYTLLIAVPLSMDRMAAEASKGLRLIVQPHNSYRLPAKYCQSIKRIPHVLGCAPEIVWAGIFRNPRDLIMTNGVTPEISTVISASDYVIAPAKIQEFNADRRNVLIGRLQMREHHWKLGQPLTLRSPSDPRLTLTFIPVLELPTDYLSRTFFFNRRLLDDAVKGLYGVDIQARATFIVVRVDQAENLGAVADAVDESFHNAEFETDTLTESDTLANYVSAIGDVRNIIYALCLVVLMTVLLIAANSMTMLVRDRINEVAVMRALGFTRRHVAFLLMSEAALIAVAGAAVGVAVALGYFGQGVTLGALTGSIGHIEVRVTTAAAGVMTALGVSILSAIMPVLHAVRVAPAMALREVT
ncbi:MAG: FtsX-like permease family protein [Deltaproteobacteria bacterium]|nr:FtsX-like permease family protein [Deltaproteobacteria bacterium]